MVCRSSMCGMVKYYLNNYDRRDKVMIKKIELENISVLEETFTPGALGLLCGGNCGGILCGGWCSGF